MRNERKPETLEQALLFNALSSDEEFYRPISSPRPCMWDYVVLIVFLALVGGVMALMCLEAWQ